MKRIITVKNLINKKNGQINWNPKKSEMPRDYLDHIMDIKKLRISLEGWE